ncbi:hypothetical protein HMPREF0083_02543 [Aneurinibacillus aneurinilyticus ATCC 12856]|jgi:hypothetical protein|uniref:Uncharacterized protein n=1 Tax=Aneurinibacillus aneurinilyticus ATCC 12856 TaxID=649747 RepID=U1X4B1_ANEAE|nr:hypothetical protein HMPREF0083_02543 [Aneurinibacillus aneurinilyticus ATCC 12856]
MSFDILTWLTGYEVGIEEKCKKNLTINNMEKIKKVKLVIDLHNYTVYF